MFLVAAALFGVSTTCITWYFLQARQSQQAVSSRLAQGSSMAMAFPYAVLDTPHIQKKTKDEYELTLDDAEKNKIAKNLFLAGIRSNKNVRFFKFLSKLSFIMPISLFVLYGLMGSLTLKNIVVFSIVGVILYFYVGFTIRMFKNKRQKNILRNLPEFLDLLVVCVESGLSFNASLEHIIEESNQEEPLTQEFRTMHHEYLGGLPLAQACERMAKRCDVSDLSVLLSAIIQSDQLGASLGRTLRIQSEEMRDKYRQRIRTRAYRTTVMLLFPMLMVFVAFLLFNLTYLGFYMKTLVSGN